MLPLSNCICPKLFEEKLCDTLLVDGYNGDSTSSMLLPPRPCPKPNGLCWEPATVGLSGILTLPSPELIGLQRLNRKGDGILRTDVVDVLLCLNNGRYDRRKNLGVQLTHDNAQTRKMNEIRKTTIRITGLIFIRSIS